MYLPRSSVCADDLHTRARARALSFANALYLGGSRYERERDAICMSSVSHMHTSARLYPGSTTIKRTLRAVPEMPAAAGNEKGGRCFLADRRDASPAIARSPSLGF